jgi:hypothetical protein
MKYAALWAGVLLLLSGVNPAAAQCALPYQLTNSQLADATKVMANFKALVRCLAPGGATNSIEYKSSGTGLGGVGPLANGQLVIGATGGAPQAKTLTAGANIAIANGAGSITISRTALYGQLMSATPTSATTGLTNWLNQGSSVISDSDVGICIDAPANANLPNVTGRYMAAPTAPYKITALVAATRNSTNNNAIGIGWYDGVNKLHLLSYAINTGGTPILTVSKFNNPTSFNAYDFSSPANVFVQPIWLQLADNGTTVSFLFSQDGVNFVSVFSVTKSSGFLGAGGYSNVLFFANPQSARTLATVLSWTQS